MTDNLDNSNEEHVIPVNASLHQDADDIAGDEEFSDDEMVADDLALDQDELTPNDIFGLDPLDVLTLEELAEYLKVSPAAARRVIKDQNLPGRNIGGEWRFLRDAVANWLRGQEAGAQQQQKARDDYKSAEPKQEEGDRYSRPPQRSYQSESSGGGYRPRQQYSEGGQQYGQYGNRGGQQGAGQYGNRGGQQYGGQYGNRGGQQGGEQSGYGGSGGSYSRPPRRPFRAAENAGGGSYSEGGGTGGYGGGGAQGGQFGGGGYGGGGQRFAGGPKRKNKRQVFESERGKRMDRRKDQNLPEGEE